MVACDSDTCSSCDDLVGVLNDIIIEDTVANSDNFYLLKSTSVLDDSSSGSSILSFASVALCALFSYVLLL